MLLDLPCRNKECARCLRLQSFIVDLSYLQLNPKTSRSQTLNPANPAQPHGRGGILLSPRRNHTGLQRVHWLWARPVLPLLVTSPKYFYDLGETFYVASFIFIMGNFYCLNFLRRQSLKWFYFVFSRHLWVLT